MLSRRTITIYMVCASFLRIFPIWRADLWYDEYFTRALVSLPFERMMQAVVGDVHPPLWYLVEWSLFHWWPAPGWALRIPSALFGILACWMYWLLVKRLVHHRSTQAASLALMATLPFQLWFSQEARMYSLFECLVIGCAIAVHKHNWKSFTLYCLGMCYLQNYGLIFSASMAIAAMLLWPSSKRRVIECGLIVLLCWSPWAIVLMLQMQSIHGNYWIAPTSVGSSLYVIFQAFWSNGLPVAGMIPGMMLTFAAIIWGTTEQLRMRDGSGRIILTIGFLPLLIAYLVSVIYQPIILWRAFIGSAPFWYILASRPLEKIRSLRHALIAAIFALPLILSAAGGYYRVSTAWKGDSATMSFALDYIRAHWKKGDAIFVTDDGPMMAWYLSASDLPVYRMEQCQPPRGGLTEQTRTALGIPAMAPGDIPAKRLWVAAPISPLHPGCYVDQVETLLAAENCRSVYPVDNNEWIQSAVYLCEER
jgi:hypothetical protein